MVQNNRKIFESGFHTGPEGHLSTGQEEVPHDQPHGGGWNPGVNVINFVPSSLMMRPNKLEGSPLETFSSEALEFECKARTNQIGGPYTCFRLG